jgi:hypothetical protein
LTEYGQELEDVIVRFGRWGAKSLGEPRPDEIVTPDSMVMALRSTFDPQAARQVRATFELRVGDIVVNARVDHGKLEAAAGELPAAELVIEAGPGIRALFLREITPDEAVKSGVVRLRGTRELFDAFATVFRI